MPAETFRYPNDPMTPEEKAAALREAANRLSDAIASKAAMGLLPIDVGNEYDAEFLDALKSLRSLL